jgi:hypothetical protein
MTVATRYPQAGGVKVVTAGSPEIGTVLLKLLEPILSIGTIGKKVLHTHARLCGILSLADMLRLSWLPLDAGVLMVHH